MKIRSGFVSNSSSSSFVVDRSYVSDHQLDQIKNHIEVASDLYPDIAYCEDHNQWDITIKPGYVSGDTWMDNFDMKLFLEKIGIDMEQVEWRH